jgi:hypothetical protein
MKSDINIKLKLFQIMSILFFVMIVSSINCKQKNNNYKTTKDEKVTWEDVKFFDYPDIEAQKKDFEKFNDIFESQTSVENPDKVLRQMAERTSVNYIRDYLQELSRTISVKEKPNISVFLKIIIEMKDLDDPNAIKFIEKAKANRNADKLCLALYELHDELQQAKAADALATLKKAESVKVLTMRLLLAGGMLGRMGGVEGQYITGNLCKSLVKAIESCTGLSFPNYNPENETETLAIAKRCQEWLEKHPQKD